MAAVKVTELTINGRRSAVNVEPDVPLLSVLRDHLDLTGTKYGCGEGRCGACTVMIDGKPTRSCVTPVAKVVDKNITTIEGLAKEGKLSPLQEAFIKADALQCAFCTSGMIVSASALLNQNAHPTREEIVNFMNGNVCRCGVYQRIVEAIQSASDNRSAAE
jgi:aerobic-type carbon monoxide dehydrogenase small subunit (CoxS/CutS family)